MENLTKAGLSTQTQEWIYNIRGYYDRGKFFVNLGC